MVQTPEEYKVPIITGRGWGGLPEPSKIMYKDRYFQPNEDYEVWLDRVTRTYSDSREHRGRMKQYFRNYWFHTSTPPTSNAGLPQQGYPVSCFVQEVGDSKKGIIDAWVEGFYLGAKGAGIGGDWSNVRSANELVGKNGKTSGIIPFIKVDESLTLAVSQGGLRRASKAEYLKINHPEIMEFISLRDPSGDPYRRTPQLFTGVVIDDEFMKAVYNRSTYKLKSPKTDEVIEEVDAFEVWTALLEMRMKRGAPYILFIDSVNSRLPEEYKKEGWKVNTSNLCSEIVLHTAPNYSAICVLSSINLEYWDEFSADEELFKQFLYDVHRFVDNILEDFLINAEKEEGFEKVVKSGRYERSIGIGSMGYHYYFQKKGIPLESYTAKLITEQIFSKIKEVFDESNYLLAKEKGASPLAEKHGIMKRNTHVTSIAPTASISTLCGMTSQGIDPLIANSYLHKTNFANFYVRNRYLEKELEKLGKNTEEVWASIRDNDGSVQHLDFLLDDIKEVYKTAYEVKQEAIIELAKVRTKYIDQSQSLNLFIRPPVNPQYLHDLHMFAWAKGIKSLYYIRSDKTTKVGNLKVGVSANSLVDTIKPKGTDRQLEECVWCG